MPRIFGRASYQVRKRLAHAKAFKDSAERPYDKPCANVGGWKHYRAPGDRMSQSNFYRSAPQPADRRERQWPAHETTLKKSLGDGVRLEGLSIAVPCDQPFDLLIFSARRSRECMIS